MTTDSLSLFCYVRGDDGGKHFKVDIDKAKTVSDLREVIKDKKKPRFDDIPADSLFLWNVSVPINRDLENGVEALNLLENDALSAGRILSDIFPDLGKNCIHVVIDRYSGEL